jgi:hypothetical protein
MRGMTSWQALDPYRCPNRNGPDGQRCQLLIEHPGPHIAQVGGVFRPWAYHGADTALPPSPYRWFYSFPRDET